MVTKARLHELVELLSDTDLSDAERLLEERVRVASDEAERLADEAWMNADLSNLGLYEPYDWGGAGPQVGLPVRFVPGEGLIIIDDASG